MQLEIEGFHMVAARKVKKRGQARLPDHELMWVEFY